MPKDEPTDQRRKRLNHAVARAKEKLQGAMRRVLELADPSPPAKGPRQTKAEELLGMSQSQISETLNGKREPRLDTLINMADFLGQSIDEMLELPTNLKQTDIEALMHRIDVDTASRLYERLREYFGSGHAELDRQTVTVTPSMPPAPQLVEAEKDSLGSHVTEDNKSETRIPAATIRRKRTRRRP